jgi:hypothetical protein
MVLRPRLSAGLPVSDDKDRQLNGAYVTTPPKTRVKGLIVVKNVRFCRRRARQFSLHRTQDGVAGMPRRGLAGWYMENGHTDLTGLKV